MLKAINSGYPSGGDWRALRAFINANHLDPAGAMAIRWDTVMASVPFVVAN
jgi:hypothetical protein